MSWPAGGSWDVISPFHSGVSLPLTRSSSRHGWVLCTQPQQELSPSSVHTPVTWELLIFVGVCVSAVEQVLLSLSHGQAYTVPALVLF